MTVTTRFAPSPTGLLHIGSARTALFNWLFAKHFGGNFLLRIEDTDQQRSTDEAVKTILNGLDWLGLNWDKEVIFQSQRKERHQQIAKELLSRGMAYHCYCSPEELLEMREVAKVKGGKLGYDRRCRDNINKNPGSTIKPALRFRAPINKDVCIQDKVQGEVNFPGDQFDDLILLRNDETPTYMLAVVVDDHDMEISHVIRGVDHLTNAARQTQIYEALGWEPPIFGHIPLIHGPDGSKLSKRHGSTAAEEYQDMGFLPEAMRNYLSRLGWAHGDDEIFSTKQAIKWFGLESVGRSPARFDIEKLRNLNGHYIQNDDKIDLLGIVINKLKSQYGSTLDETKINRVETLLPELRKRSKDINQLIESARFLVLVSPININKEAQKILDNGGRKYLNKLEPLLSSIEIWTIESLEKVIKEFAEKNEIKLIKIAQPIRAALTGKLVSPGIFELLIVLGRDESLKRISFIE